MAVGLKEATDVTDVKKLKTGQSASTPSISDKLGAAATIASKLSSSDSSGSSSSPLSAGLSGAATGAATGTGPVGIAVGATLGVVGAIAENKAKRKAESRRIEAEKWKAIGEIQQNSGIQQANILQNLIGSLRGSFIK